MYMLYNSYSLLMYIISLYSLSVVHMQSNLQIAFHRIALVLPGIGKSKEGQIGYVQAPC